MRIQIVGRGRMGTALFAAFQRAGIAVAAPMGRGGTASGAGADAGTDSDSDSGVDVVLLAVPDAEIAAAAARVPSGPLVGHLSGATGLDVFGERESFSLHPLLTVTADTTSFRGAYAAVDGSSERAQRTATQLAEALDLIPMVVQPAARPVYHAAASVAANALLAVTGLAERLAAAAGVPRAALLPLVEAAVANWAEGGAAAALTGPVVRGDEETVQRQRTAVAARGLETDTELYDALLAATRVLAAEQHAMMLQGTQNTQQAATATQEETP